MKVMRIVVKNIAAYAEKFKVKLASSVRFFDGAYMEVKDYSPETAKAFYSLLLGVHKHSEKLHKAKEISEHKLGGDTKCVSNCMIKIGEASGVELGKTIQEKKTGQKNTFGIEL